LYTLHWVTGCIKHTPMVLQPILRSLTQQQNSVHYSQSPTLMSNKPWMSSVWLSGHITMKLSGSGFAYPWWLGTT